MPFGEWIDFWYQTYCKHTIRLTTQLEYESRIYSHIIPEIGDIPLNKLTQSDLQQFYARTKSGGRRIRVEAYGAGLSDRVAAYLFQVRVEIIRSILLLSLCLEI